MGVPERRWWLVVGGNDYAYAVTNHEAVARQRLRLVPSAEVVEVVPAGGVVSPLEDLDLTYLRSALDFAEARGYNAVGARQAVAKLEASPSTDRGAVSRASDEEERRTD